MNITQINEMSYPDFVAFIGQKNTPPGGEKTVAQWIHLAKVNSDSLILDLACSTGFSSTVASLTTGCTGVGVDISSAAIQVASENAKNHGLSEKLKYFVGDAGQLEFDDGYFSHILAGGTFAFMREKERCLAQCKRVLKKNGFLCLSNFSYHTSPPEDLLSQIEASIGFRPDPNWTENYWGNLFGRSLLLRESVSLKLTLMEQEELEYLIFSFIFNESESLRQYDDDIKQECFNRLLLNRKILNEHRKYQHCTIEVWQSV